MKESTENGVNWKIEASLLQKLKKIAKVNGLSVNDVAKFAVASGLPMVETKLKELREPMAKAA